MKAESQWEVTQVIHDLLAASEIKQAERHDNGVTGYSVYIKRHSKIIQNVFGDVNVTGFTLSVTHGWTGQA